MPKLLLTILAILPLSLQGQRITQATVTDDQNKSIPYANVSLLHTSIRTVTGVDGSFDLSFEEDNLLDTLVISYVGYESYQEVLKEFLEHTSGQVVLYPSITQLSEFVFSDRPLKQKVLGSKNAGSMIQVGFSSVGPGDQIGTLFNIKDSPTFINKLHVKPTYVNNDSLLFRLNFYRIRKGLPAEKMITPLIKFYSHQLKDCEVFTLDLEEYGIIMSEDFYLSLECLENPDPDGKLIFAGSVTHGPIIGRLQEDAEWRKIPLFGVGFFLSTEY